MNKKSVFGPHLTLDLEECDVDKLSDFKHIFNVLNDLPDKIGMTKITQPYVFPYSGAVPEDKGITGVVIIAESHISIHTFQEKGYAFIDLFSCRPFEIEVAADYLVKAFGAKKVQKNILERGLNFPRKVAPLTPVI